MNQNIKPKVSIVVPVYKVEQYLERCLETLVKQTLDDIEIILVNDGSPDNSPKICENYAKKDKRIKVVHKKNAGLGYARNSGLEVATGEFVAFVDSDDFVEKTMYEELYNYAKESESDVVYSNYFIYTNKNVAKPLLHVNKVEQFEGRDEVFDFMIDMVGNLPHFKTDKRYGVAVWHAIYKNEIIKRNNILFKSEREYISEDTFFHVELLPHVNKISYLPTCNYYYCDNEGSLTNTYRADRFEKSKYLHGRIYECLLKTYPNKAKRIKLAVDRYLIGSVRANMLNDFENRLDIKKIMNDKYLQNVFQTYPVFKLPFKHLIFAYLAKNKMIILIKILKKLANIARHNTR